jgi:hypothetical protein
MLFCWRLKVLRLIIQKSRTGMNCLQIISNSTKDGTLSKRLSLLLNDEKLNSMLFNIRLTSFCYGY